MQDTTLKQRMAEFLAYLKIGQAKFAEAVGLSKGFANNVGDSIRADNLKKISSVYPELNLSWLLTGEGLMLKGDGNVIQKMGDVHGSVIAHTVDNTTVGGRDAADLESENKRLRAEVEHLRKQNEKLLDQNMKLTNKLLN